jgi:hypothetical protein
MRLFLCTLQNVNTCVIGLHLCKWLLSAVNCGVGSQHGETKHCWNNGEIEKEPRIWRKENKGPWPISVEAKFVFYKRETLLTRLKPRAWNVIFGVPVREIVLCHATRCYFWRLIHSSPVPYISVTSVEAKQGVVQRKKKKGPSGKHSCVE